MATARNSGGNAGNSILVHLINGGKNMSFAIKKMMFRSSEMGWIEETRNGLSFYLVGVTKGGRGGCAVRCCVVNVVFFKFHPTPMFTTIYCQFKHFERSIRACLTTFYSHFSFKNILCSRFDYQHYLIIITGS